MSRLATLHPERLDPAQEALLAERCILVDERDRAVGEASKRDCHVIDEATGRSPLHRAFSLFVFNERDELLMQKR
jgi:isopentenyl-diphosphate delta-isomerase